MSLRARVLGAMVTLVCVAVAGCGSSGRPPSALDPAHVVPANAIAYLEVTVRPQGAQRDSVETALSKLLGHSPDADLQRGIRFPGLSYKRDIQPWLGQRVGLVATGFSLSGVSFIAPTNDPAAAVAAIARGERKRGRQLTSATYHGVSYRQFDFRGTTGAIGAVGHYAVLGGTSAFKQIVDTFQGRAASLRPPPYGTIAGAYVNTTRAVAAAMALPTVRPAVRRQLRRVLGQAHLPSTVALSVSATAHAFTADVRSSGAPASGTATHGSDVSGAPGDSWLAIATGSSFARQFAAGARAGFLQGFSRAAHASGVNPNQLLARLRRRTGIDLTRDLLPALGPFHLAVEGSSLTALRAGLALYPADPAAGTRLVGELRNLAARDRSLRVLGGSRSFRFGPTSLPFPIVGVADLGRKIIARFALSSTQPASGTLSSNQAFRRARSRLPAGSTVPLFLDFGPLTSLLSQTPQFKPGGADHKSLAVLRRLDYFAIGVNSAGHDFRVALGLH